MKIRDHLHRAGFQLGRRMQIGRKSYGLKGYYSSNFALNDIGAHEAGLLAVLKRRLPARKGAFLDVGVNIGQTLYKMLSVDPTREYFGFEPLLSCCNDVIRFAEFNHLANVHVLPVGLSNRNGIATFYSHGPFDSTASLLPQGHSRMSYIQIRRGDEIIRELGLDSVAIIKVDVEGAEWEVFDGFRNTLEGCRPLLMFEVLPNFVGEDRTRVPESVAKENQQRLDRLVNVLSDCGYRIKRVHPHGQEEPVDSIDLDDTGAYVSNDYTATAD
jgi:FkbM family methyltransferase